jgi:hypothetical protein
MSAGKSDGVELVGFAVRAVAAVFMLGAHAASAVVDKVQKVHARAEEQRRLEAAQRQAEEQQRASEQKRHEELRRLQVLRDARQSCRAAAGKIGHVTEQISRLQTQFRGAKIEVAKPTLPPIPETEDIDVLRQHERSVNSMVEQYARAVKAATDAAQSNAAFAQAISSLVDLAAKPATTAAEALAFYAATNPSASRADATDKVDAERDARMTRARESFSDIPADCMPDDIPRLFDEFAETCSQERAEALAVELQVRAAGLRRELEDRRADERLAAEWVAELTSSQGSEPEPFETAKLRHQLSLVAAGESRMTPQIKMAFEADHARRKAVEDRTDRQCAAIVLEATLRELGYDTDSIDNTLFVEGGTVHYQRGEWGDYYMQLRVVPALGQANFSLVRVGEGAASASEDEVRQEQYCSDEQMGALREALAARGVRLRSRHANKPGEVPVASIQESTLGQALRERRAAVHAAKRSPKKERQRKSGEK